MKNRYSSITGVLVLGALVATTGWYWFAWEPHVRFKAGELEILSRVSMNTSGAPVLTVGFRNHKEYSAVTIRSLELRGPFRVHLRDARTGTEILRLPASLKGPVGEEFTVPKKSATRWNLALNRLYGRVSPGKYILTVYYDTETAQQSGEKWAQDIDIGKIESKPVVFEIKAGSGIRNN